MNREEALKVIEGLIDHCQQVEGRCTAPPNKVESFAVFSHGELHSARAALDYLKSETSGELVRVEDVDGMIADWDILDDEIARANYPHERVDGNKWQAVARRFRKIKELPRYPGVDADAAAREIVDSFGMMPVSPTEVVLDRTTKKLIAAIINRYVKGADNAENH